MVLGSTQPLTEMNTRSISWGKCGWCVRLTILPPSCAVFVKSGNLNILEAIFTGHAPVRGHLYTMGLFDGDPTCRFCRKETETVQHITCCCEALARQRYNVFGNLIVEPKDISTASIKDLCLYIKGTGLLNLR
jgi:hypothetical protein